MNRDQGPAYNLGFGVTSRDVGPEANAQLGSNPNAGVLSKSLADHPVMRFFATTAATLVATAVASQTVRKGGIKLFAKMQESELPYFTRKVADIRKLRDIMDDWQGAVRTAEAYLPENASKLFWEDPDGQIRVGNKLLTDGTMPNGELNTLRGWHQTYDEQQQARAYGRVGAETPSDWTIKDELTQRLVSQARRLPYELPAAYIAQRGVTDRLFGNQEKDQINWANPIDVVTDFVTQSVKNTAFMFSPFEAGQAGASQGWRKLMTYGDGGLDLTRAQRTLGRQAVGLRDVLSEVGHDAATVVNGIVDYSAQSTGAFATGIKVANDSQMGLVDFLHAYRHGTKQAIADMDAKGIKRAELWSEKARVYLNLKDALDYMPGSPLDALPVAKGAGSGVSAARAEWTSIKEQRQAVNAMLNKGRNAFIRDNPDKVRALNEAMQTGASPVEELMGALNRLSGGAPVMRNGKINPDWKKGDFYQSRVTDAFNARLRQELKNYGVSDEAIERFHKVVGVESPFVNQKDYSKRFTLNGKSLQVANQDELWSQMASRMNIRNPEQFISAMPKALDRADQLFRNRKYLSSLDKQTVSEWNLFYNEAFPRLGESVLGKNNLPYQMFQGNITRAKQSFLTRRTAEMTGLRMRDDAGNIVSDAMVEGHLSKMGFDPGNFGQMRAYLAKHKAISQPWNRHGGNVFGMRAVSVADALDRGYFAASPSNKQFGGETEIRNLLGVMANRDPVSALGNYKVGGLYETAHGQILDFNLIRRGVRKFTDKVADDFQIPLIHLSPLKTMGYSGFRNMRERSMIQYVSGDAFQPFLGQKQAADFYMWSRASARGSKGIVSSFKWNDERTALRENILPGKFRTIATAGNTIEAHQAKIAAGDLGRVAIGPRYDRDGNQLPPTKLQKFKNLFNISDYQPDSLMGWASRFRTRKTDLQNPVVMAKLLQGKAVVKGESRLVLRDGSVIDETTGRIVHGQHKFAEAYDQFADLFRVKGISPKVEHQPGIDEVFSVELKNGGKVVPSGKVRLSDVKSQAQTIEFAKLLASQDVEQASALPREVQNSLSRAQKLLVYRHIKNEPNASYWDSAVPGVSGSISTRMDQFRSDIQEYMIIRKGLMDKGGFDQTVAELSEHLDALKKSGQISQAQYIESRSALLGTQLDFTNLSSYRPTTSTLEDTQSSIRSLMGGSRGAVSSDLLGDIAAGKFNTQSGGGWAGRFGRVEPYLKRHFGTAPYNYAGQEYNPFGRGGAAIVPTFGTTFARNPRTAIASVLGINTYSNPEAYSGLSAVSGHLVERLNKSFGLAGISLDPTKYKGPMDMYARGLVGQRILPLVAAGTAAVAVDRTIGGFANPKDQNGDRVYSPFFLGKAATGFAYAQAGLAGLVPGGETYEQKYHEIFEGEVAVRSGRWWPLGNTPWKGGRVQYFRPSWYRRLQSGYSYTSDTYGSPLQRLLYGYDFSPLRPLDPYKFERDHYEDRPYPVTGEYFSGPWGPVTSVLNATVGRFLKPQIKMHKDEMKVGLSQYLPAGEQGAYFAPPGSAAAMSFFDSPGAVIGGKGRGGGSVATGSGTYIAGRSSGVTGGGYPISASNQSYAAAGRVSPATGRNIAFSAIGQTNAAYAQAAYGAVGTPGAMPPKIMGAAPPLSTRSPSYQARQFGYELQEMAGIYGFAAGAARSALGFGNQDLTTPTPVLESSSRAYGSTRGFWSLGLGGLGDVPTPLEGSLANLEISEIIRRFVPRERTATQFINPIPNQMGKKYPWLPDSQSGYYIDFSKGDPFTKVPEGEMRLPGKGYQRLHSLHPDQYGQYGLLDQFRILADVAPWSAQYRNVDKLVDSAARSSADYDMIQTIRDQVGEKAKEHNFTPYVHKYAEPLPGWAAALDRGWEKIQHLDTPFNTKFMPYETATEDWERNNVYGSTFPQWQHPIKDFFEPMLYKSTQRDPLHAALVLGGTGTLFGKSAKGKVIGGVIGSALGFVASSLGHIEQAISGRRYMPEDRRKEVALEEYSDILTYVKDQHLANVAQSVGDVRGASEYKRQASSTLYGIDVYNAPLNQIVQAVPKRKREYFQAMMTAPEQERDQILSTAGILERRALQAIWGRPVERRPDLEEYFQDHELPPGDSSMWHPNTNMDQVKIKVGQSMGLDLSQMGYYPQQIQEANLVNPAYPSFEAHSSGRDVRAQLDNLLYQHGIKGSVRAIPNPHGTNKLEINAGIF